MLNVKQWNESNDPFYTQRNVLACDLDDTLTEHDGLKSSIIEKLETVQSNGVSTLLVTGRPAGWADTIIRLLPFDAVICENGAAIYYWSQGKLKKQNGEGPIQLFWHEGNQYKTELPESHAETKSSAKESILKAFPKAKIASDQNFRLYDLAIDFAEEVVPSLGLDEARLIKKKFESLGATAKVSSIHVNGWWGSFSKSSALKYLAEELYHFSMKENLIYVGDSPNDAPLFDAAGASFGVANLSKFFDKIDFPKPQYITNENRSHGVEEIISKISLLNSP